MFDSYKAVQASVLSYTVNNPTFRDMEVSLSLPITGLTPDQIQDGTVEGTYTFVHHHVHRLLKNEHDSYFNPFLKGIALAVITNDVLI